MHCKYLANGDAGNVKSEIQNSKFDKNGVQSSLHPTTYGLEVLVQLLTTKKCPLEVIFSDDEILNTILKLEIKFLIGIL